VFLKNNNIIDSSCELGEFKHEYFCDTAIFVKPKMYFSKKVKLKGLKSTASQEDLYDSKKEFEEA
jgi:hypothetical protein